MTAKLKRHILHSIDKCDPNTALSYCGRYLPYEGRRNRFVKDWDDATCKVCIQVMEDEEPDWTHPSNRS